MRSAPPVHVPVGRFVWGPRISVGLALSTALLCTLAAGWQGGGGKAHLPVAISWLASAVWAGWAWSRERLPAGELSWDGEAWCYRVQGSQQPEPVAVELVWDAGQAMLLRLSLQGSEHRDAHVWLRARQMPLLWHGLRCAVHDRDTL